MGALLVQWSSGMVAVLCTCPNVQPGTIEGMPTVAVTVPTNDVPAAVSTVAARVVTEVALSDVTVGASGATNVSGVGA